MELSRLRELLSLEKRGVLGKGGPTVLQPPSTPDSSSSSASSRALSLTSPGSRSRRGASFTAEGARAGRPCQGGAGERHAQHLPFPGGERFPGCGVLSAPASPHTQNQSCSLGNPYRNPNQINLCPDKSERRMGKNLATHINAFARTHAVEPLVCLRQAPPKFITPGKKKKAFPGPAPCLP